MPRKTGQGAKSLGDYFASNAGVSKTALANALGISPSMVTRYISGERTPRLALAVRISDLTGVPVEQLIGGGKKVAA